jgi:hypothetical protein
MSMNLRQLNEETLKDKPPAMAKINEMNRIALKAEFYEAIQML